MKLQPLETFLKQGKLAPPRSPPSWPCVPLMLRCLAAMASFQLGLGALGLWMVNSEGQGNEICFHPHPNWINLHLTYEDWRVGRWGEPLRFEHLNLQIGQDGSVPSHAGARTAVRRMHCMEPIALAHWGASTPGASAVTWRKGRHQQLQVCMSHQISIDHWYHHIYIWS